MNVLEKTELDFIKLYMSGITGKTYDLSEVDVPMITKLALFHSVGNAVFYGLKNHNINPNDELNSNNKLLKHKTLTQDLEYEEIKNNLNEKGIRYIFLKGIKLRKYYKLPEVREMGDIDFLVDIDNLDASGEILLNLGYELEHKSFNHDSYIKKPFMNIEVHSKLFDETSFLFKYNDGVWDKTIKIDNSYEHEMEINEFYIYNLGHAANHFRAGGTGVRIIGDTFLLLENEKLDLDYIKQRLDIFGLSTFNDLIISIGKKINNEDILTDDEELILKYIISSGTYGVFSHRHGHAIARSKGKNMFFMKVKTFFRRIFPKYQKMEVLYPRLKKCQLLLPYYYIKRLIKNIGNKKRIKQEFGALKNLDNESIDFLIKVNDIAKVGENKRRK